MLNPLVISLIWFAHIKSEVKVMPNICRTRRIEGSQTDGMSYGMAVVSRRRKCSSNYQCREKEAIELKRECVTVMFERKDL